jgi:hypothetical protein
MAALDMQEHGFGGAEGAAVQLGKALGNPIRGIQALTRSGIEFTDAEREKITALVESNKMLEAQDIIMTAIERQVKGTAAATANGTAKIKNAISLVIEDAAKPMARAFEGISETVLAMAPAITATMDRIAPKIASVSNAIGTAISEALLGNKEHIVKIGNIIGEALGEAIIQGAIGTLGEIGHMIFKGNTSARTPTGKLLRDVFGEERIEKSRGFMADAMSDERSKRIETVINKMGDALTEIEREGMVARREALMLKANEFGRFDFDMMGASATSNNAVDAILREIQTLNRNLAGFPN